MTNALYCARSKYTRLVKGPPGRPNKPSVVIYVRQWNPKTVPVVKSLWYHRWGRESLDPARGSMLLLRKNCLKIFRAKRIFAYIKGKCLSLQERTKPLLKKSRTDQLWGADTKLFFFYDLEWFFEICTCTFFVDLLPAVVLFRLTKTKTKTIFRPGKLEY